MFIGYVAESLDELLALADLALVGKLKALRFYLFWTGCYFPPALEVSVSEDFQVLKIVDGF